MNRVQQKFVIDALEQPEVLTEWEFDFINSLAEIPEEQPLTEKQNAVLNRIQKKLE